MVPCYFFVQARLYPKRTDEHEVHPYMHRDILCRGESCIRPNYTSIYFYSFSDGLKLAVRTLFSRSRILIIVVCGGGWSIYSAVQNNRESDDYQYYRPVAPDIAPTYKIVHYQEKSDSQGY